MTKTDMIAEAAAIRAALASLHDRIRVLSVAAPKDASLLLADVNCDLYKLLRSVEIVGLIIGDEA